MVYYGPDEILQCVDFCDLMYAAGATCLVSQAPQGGLYVDVRTA